VAVILWATDSPGWYRERLAGGMFFGCSEDLENSPPVCSNGVIFLPYLNGGRTPCRDSDARSWVKLAETSRLDPWRSQQYTTWYEEYRQLYWSVKDQYRRIQNLLERGK
jgi:hypothetical protein